MTIAVAVAGTMIVAGAVVMTTVVAAMMIAEAAT
jgi:hypothetical protein